MQAIAGRAPSPGIAAGKAFAAAESLDTPIAVAAETSACAQTIQRAHHTAIDQKRVLADDAENLANEQSIRATTTRPTQAQEPPR